MIHFVDVTLKNFLSFGETETTVALDRSKTTLITGVNGAGKSTIAEAVCYSLFNKSFRGINLPKFVNTTNQKGMVIKLRFRKGDDEYVVTRGQKPAIFTIQRNGEPLKEDANSRDFQTVLEEILGFDYNTFIKTILIGLANYKPFLKLTLPERRAFVDVMLNVGIYTTMNVLHKAKVSTWKADRQMLDVKLDSARSFLDSANRNYARVAEMGANRVKQLEADLSRAAIAHDEVCVPDEVVFTAKYPDARTNFTSAESVLNLVRTKLTRSQTINESIIRLERELVSATDELGAIEVPGAIPFEQKAVGAKERVDEINKRLSDISVRKATLKSEMMTLSKRAEFFEKHNNCEVCEQEIGDGHKNSIIEKARGDARPLMDEFKALTVETGELETERGALIDAITDDNNAKMKAAERDTLIERKVLAVQQAERRVDDIKGKLEKARSEIFNENELNERVAELEALKEQYRVQCDDDKASQAMVAVKNAEIKQVAQRKGFLKLEVERITKEIDAAKNTDVSQFVAEVERAKGSVEELEVQETESDSVKRVMDACTELLKDTGIKANVVKVFIPILNKQVNDFLETMGAQYRVELDEDFNASFTGRFKDEFVYEMLSQGERQRADFAFMFGCIKVAQLCAGIETNLLFLDEIGDSSMDFEGIEAIFQIVERAYGDKNVFFISHRVEMSDKCRSLIRLSKKSGFTKIV